MLFVIHSIFFPQYLQGTDTFNLFEQQKEILLYF